MCELLVGLPDGERARRRRRARRAVVVHVESRAAAAGVPGVRRGGVGEGPAGGGAGGPAVLRAAGPAGVAQAPLVLPGRWMCEMGSWTGRGPARSPPARVAMTDRAGRWVTDQVGRLGRTVAEVARELGCDWHTVNDAVIAYGTPLVEDPDRIGEVDALGLDETLFCRQGRWRTQQWCTSIVDVSAGRPSSSTSSLVAAPAGPAAGSRPAPRSGARQIRFGVLDLSGPYRKTFDDTLRRRHPGRRPVPSRQAGQLEAGRVPPAGAERDPRPPGPQGRPALPGPAAADQGPRTPRRPRRHQAAGPARRRRPSRRGAHGLARQGSRALDLRHHRPRPRRRVRRPARRRPARRVLPARGALAGPHHRPLARPDRRLAPRPRVATGRPKRSTT